jgi:Ras family
LIIFPSDFHHRTVPYNQGAALAAEFGIPFIECSSKTGENIGEAFSLLLSEVEKENPLETVDNFSQPECVTC